MEGGQATSATAVPGFSAKERERRALRIRSSRIRVLIHSLFVLLYPYTRLPQRLIHPVARRASRCRSRVWSPVEILQ